MMLADNSRMHIISYSLDSNDKTVRTHHDLLDVGAFAGCS